MGKIKNWFKQVGAKIKNPSKGKQGKAFVRVVQFFAIILALTIFARGASGVTMPEVTVTGLQSQSIREERQYSGVVKSTAMHEVELPAGLTVDEVFASPGESVRAGDELISFDADLIQEELLNQNAVLLTLQQDLQNLLNATGPDDSAVKAAEERRDDAQLDANEAVIDRDTAKVALDNANAALVTAQQNLASMNNADYKAQKIAELQTTLTAQYQQNYDDAVAAEKTAGDIYNQAVSVFTGIESSLKLNDDDSSNDEAGGVNNAQYIVAKQEMKTALANWEAAKTVLEEATTKNTPDSVALEAEQIYSAEISAAQTAVTNAQTTINEAALTYDENYETAQFALETLQTAQEALDEAVSDFNEAQSNTALAEKIRQNNIRRKQQEISRQQEKIAEIQELASAGATVYAPADGTVMDVTVLRGAVTTEADYVSISTGEEGYMVEFAVTVEQARDIKIGGSVVVMPQGYTWGSNAQVIGRTAPDESGNIPIRAQLSDTGWSDGDLVSVSVLISDRQYWNCVPVSAVRPDGSGYYVLVLEEENTILGTQTVARKMPVTIQDQNQQYAAIDGIYDYEAFIVVSGSKPVNDGDTVRLAEGNVL